jgi:hypothetical protein
MSDVFVRIKTDYDNSGIAKADKALGGLLNTIGKGTIALTAFALASKQVYDFGRQGAMLDLAKTKFNNLTTSIGGTGDALMRDLRQATRGLLSDAQLVAQGGDLMSLGLAKTTEEAVRLSAAASQLGMDMNQLVLTLTNQTTMRFDALGLSVDGFKIKVKELQEAGMSADEAFKFAFIEQAEAQIKRVGDVADTTAGSFLKMEAQVANSWDRIAKGIGRFIAPAIDGIGDYLEHTNAVAVAQELLGAKWIQSAQWGDKLTITYQLLNGEYITQEDLLRRANLLLDIGHENYSDLAKAVEASGGSFRANSAEMLRWIGIAGSFPEVDIPAPTAQDITRWQDLLGLAQSGTLQKLIEDLDFGMAGGFEAAADFQFVQGLVDANKLTPDQAREMFAGIYVELQGIEQDLGLITADEAAANIERTLGLSLSEAQQFAAGIQSSLDQMQGSITTAEAIVNLTVTGDTWLAALVGNTVVGSFAGGSRHAGQYNSGKDVIERRSSGGMMNSNGWTLIGEGPGGTSPYAELVGPDGMVYPPGMTKEMLQAFKLMGMKPRGLAGGGPLLDGVAGAGANLSASQTHAWVPSISLTSGPGSGAIHPGEWHRQNPGQDPGWERNNPNAPWLQGGSNQAAQITAAANTAAQAAASGVAASSVSSSQNQSAQAIATFTQQSERMNRELIDSLERVVDAVEGLPDKSDLKNAVKDAAAELF